MDSIVDTRALSVVVLFASLCGCGSSSDSGTDSNANNVSTTQMDEPGVPSTSTRGTSTPSSSASETTLIEETSLGSTAQGSGADASSADSGSTTASTTSGNVQPTEIDDAWVARLEGTWRGDLLDGPFGDYDDYEMTFVPIENGFSAELEISSGTTMQFRFLKVEGEWELREGVQVPNGGAHSNRRLTPSTREGDRVRWGWDDRPVEEEWIDITLTANTQRWEVFRACSVPLGQRHALVDVVRK